MNVAVIIPKKSRPDVLADTLDSVRGQFLRPVQVSVSATCMQGVPGDIARMSSWEILTGVTGSYARRNAAVERLASNADIVAILDDDVELAPFYLERIVAVIAARSLYGCYMLGGRVSGKRFGYAQVVNPYWFGGIEANLPGALGRDPEIDRNGRIYGNLRGFLDVVAGQADPSRIVRIDSNA